MSKRSIASRENGKKGGRPSEFKEEYIDKVDEYLNSQIDEEYDWVRTEGNSSTTKEHRIKVKLPTLEGFANFIDVDITSLYPWEDKNVRFSQALNKIRNEQKRRLLEKGLSGDYNSLIAKLILSANHGMKEKTETDITSKGEKIESINYIVPERAGKKSEDNN